MTMDYYSNNSSHTRTLPTDPMMDLYQSNSDVDVTRFDNSTHFGTNQSSRNTSTIHTLTQDNLLLLATIVKYTNLYYIPILITIGLIGNTISFVVFTRAPLRTLSSSVYLAALSLTDTGFLLSISVSWMVNIRVDLYHKEGWCQTFVYLTYVFSFLSVCYVVSFTIERFIAVCYPLQRQQLCTVRRARIVVIAEAVFAFGAYSFAIWTSAAQKYRNHTLCFPLKKYYRLVNVLNNIDSIATLVIPFIVIFGVNIKLIHRTTLHERRTSVARTNSRHGRPGTWNNSRQNHITKMLVVVSTVFLILNLPSHIFRIYNLGMLLTSGRYRASKLEMLLQELFQLLYYTHFSVNFFLYSLCGNNFRKAIKTYICSRTVHCNVCIKGAEPTLAYKSSLRSTFTTSLLNRRHRRERSIKMQNHELTTMCNSQNPSSKQTQIA